MHEARSSSYTWAVFPCCIMGFGDSNSVYGRQPTFSIHYKPSKCSITMNGKELRNILAAKGIIHKDLAEKMGITQSCFSQLLRAQDIRTGLLEKICDILNVQMDFFYGDTKYLAQNYHLIREDIQSLNNKLDKIQFQCSQIIGKNAKAK